MDCELVFDARNAVGESPVWIAAQQALYWVDIPARKAFEGLVPDERRGRVSAFLDGMLYSLGAVLGAMLLGVASAIGSIRWSASAPNPNGSCSRQTWPAFASTESFGCG